MRRTYVQIFKHFYGNFLLFLHYFLEKLVRNCGKNMQLLVSIPEEKSIDTFLITSPLSSYFYDLFLVHTRIVEVRALQAGSAEVIHLGKNFYDSVGIRTQDFPLQRTNMPQT